MTDTERIAALEATVAALTLRDERREFEHRQMLKTFEQQQAEREALRRELEADYELLGQSIDCRLGEFAARDSVTGRPALTPEMARAIARRVTDLLARGRFDNLDGDVLHLLVGILRMIEALAIALTEAPDVRCGSGPQAA